MTAGARAGSCPDANTLTALACGSLDTTERADLLLHLDACAECRRLAAVAAATAGGSAGEPEPLLQPGQAFDRYVVVELLGVGAMGVVYAARDEALDRKVALKLVRASSRTDPEAASANERLLREARAAAAIAHPNVVVVHEVGTCEGRVFIAMELVETGTLRDWLASAVRTPHAILSMFLQAGEGLAVAHEAGVVHRDFKPDNVLVGPDGRPRVADFGVARHAAEARASDAPTVGAEREAERTLTARDTLIGTPAYMSPEQLRGARADARSDQFTFAVSVYEALAGVRPYAPAALAASRPGALPEIRSTGGRPIAGRLARVLLRALRVDPAERFADMRSLLAALRRADPVVARRRAAVAAATSTLVAAVVALGLWRGGAMSDPCAAAGRDLQGAWDQQVQASVRSAFAGTARPYAGDTASRVSALLDAYAASYSTMRHEVCEASRGGQGSRELLALRDACLDRRRGQLRALTAVFTDRSDPDVLDRAVGAAAGLLPVAFCADTEALTARLRPPEDPALRDRVAAIQPRVDRLEALFLAGQYKTGLAWGEPLLTEAAAIPYPPVAAQVDYFMGQLVERTSDNERAKALLRDAAVHAAEGRDDVLVAQAWARVLFIVGDRQRRFEEASAIRSLGPTLLARSGDGRALTSWLNAEGLLLHRMGKHTDASAVLERAVDNAEKTLGPEDPTVAQTLNNLGMAQTDAGNLAQALASHERALAIRQSVLGPDHPSVAQSLSNMGWVLRHMEDFPRALDCDERAAALWEKSLGPDHPDVAVAVNNAATVRSDQGQWPEAIALDERALAIRERAGPDHPDVAQSLFNLGTVLLASGDPARAAPLMERALSILEKALGPLHPDVGYPLAGLGRIRVRAGQLDAAGPLLERARALVDKAGADASPEIRTTTFLGLGELALARSRPADARPALEQALAAAIGDLKCEVELTLADALWPAGGDRRRARQLAEDAQAFYRRVGHKPGIDRSARWLGSHSGP